MSPLPRRRPALARRALAALLLPAPLLLLLLLAGCGPALLPWAAAEAASVMVFDRGLGDLVVSAVSGRDCSVVRLDRGESYCRPEEPPPSRLPVCTRSLGAVDCWRVAPPHAWPPHRGVADGPGSLSEGQEANRTRRRWPDLF